MQFFIRIERHISTLWSIGASEIGSSHVEHRYSDPFAEREHWNGHSGHAGCVQKCRPLCGTVCNNADGRNLHTLYAHVGWLFAWIVPSAASSVNEFCRSVLSCIRHRAAWVAEIRQFGTVSFRSILLFVRKCQSIHDYSLFFLHQENNQSIFVHNAAWILLRLFCICCRESTGSRCTLLRQIGNSILFSFIAHPNDYVEFLEKFEIPDAGITVCINFNCYRWVLVVFFSFSFLFHRS